MCSQFELTITSEEIEAAFPDLILTTAFKISERVLPSMPSAVLVSDHEKLRLTRMKFSLIPAWSQEPKVKFATHNARIESVHEKPTWKKPFLYQHCAIPISGFYESAYRTQNAGHVIEFKDESEQPLFAAGLFDYWNNDPDPKKHFFSFSILTEEPTEFILENGHDRTPIFLKIEHVKDWCDLKSESFDQTREKLRSWSMKPDLKVLIDRPLKPGWEKRA